MLTLTTSKINGTIIETTMICSFQIYVIPNPFVIFFRYIGFHEAFICKIALMGFFCVFNSCECAPLL